MPNTTTNRETTEISQVSDNQNRIDVEQLQVPVEPVEPQQDTNAPSRRQTQHDTSEILQVSNNQNRIDVEQLQVPVEHVEPQQDMNAPS